MIAQTEGGVFLDRCRQFLDERRENGNLRTLQNAAPISATEVLIDGVAYTNFASNDYLGLSRHPELIARSKEYIDKYGAGSPASRLITGNIEPYQLLEERLAKLKGTEAALIFPTGFQLNSTVLRALASSKTLFALDRLCHASLIDGATESKARWFRFHHNDANDYRRGALRVPTTDLERWIITESVFSMDGDRAPLHEFEEIARTTGAGLFIDEAHATGVLGGQGMGGRATHGVAPAYISMGTFGKGLGSFGAYLACSSLIKDFLINKCAGLIYSTALPPATLGAIDAALELIPSMDKERSYLQETADILRSTLRAAGFDTGSSTTQIIPLIVGESDDALDLARHLREHGLFAPAIRPPTVPRGMARVRLSLSSKHTQDDLDKLVSALNSWRRRND